MKTITDIQQEFGKKIAKKALSMEAIKLSPKEPFRWASGARMPIYNDNRRLLADSEARRLIAQGFKELFEAVEPSFSVIAGTSTAGIPHATTLSDILQLPLIYVRSSGKEHGLKNQIEGIGPALSIEGKRVLLIEDLISTGGSSIAAVNALRDQGAIVPYCFSIFTYQLEASKEAFETLNPPCISISLLDYESMLATAEETGYLNETDMKLLFEWRKDPFGWGLKNNFV
ncbi:MAG: orotate phosphoribosyltransferase [Spirochaetia bacterium]|nr:orotate phosphoribosyltransferase [Spirochaetia bacterium]